MEEQMNLNTEPNEQAEQTEVKTYTAEEVQAMLQAEADKRVTKALSKQKKEYEKKLSLSSLDEQQRAQAEKDMKIQELQEQLKTFQVLQNKSEVMKTLAGRGLNPSFADLIEVGEDIEEAQARIESLDKLFKAAVAEEVKKRLSTGTPKAGTGASGEITKEQFIKLSLAEQNKIYTTNPELYKKLVGN